MSILETNLALLLTIPEERQQEIQSYLLTNFCADNPYKPLSGDEILALQQHKESITLRYNFSIAGGK